MRFRKVGSKSARSGSMDRPTTPAGMRPRAGGFRLRKVNKCPARSAVEPGNDWHPGGAECRKQSAEQADNERQQQALSDQARAELEVEHHLAEACAHGR